MHPVKTGPKVHHGMLDLPQPEIAKVSRPMPYGRLRALARVAAGITPDPVKAAQADAFYKGIENHRRHQFMSRPETDAPRGLAGGYRQPGDMAEFTQLLAEHTWEWVLGSFLDHTRFYPNREALDIPPGPELREYELAYMAATVETICNERGWPVPAWTEDPSTFLPEPFVPSFEETAEFIPVTPAEISRKVQATTPAEFRRRGINVGANELVRF